MIALYARVSTREQVENGHSIDEQNDRLEKYCLALGWKDYKFYTDAGYSGANTDRPALKKLVKDVQEHKVDKFIVYKLDRLSRSQKDTLWLIEDVILENDCDFISIMENFDTSSPFGRAMIGILSVFAQLEREQIKERMAMGREGRAKEGKFSCGGMVPIGYNYIDGFLQIDEYEAMQLREAHQMFQSGFPLKVIARTFKEKGYSHKYGLWNEVRIRRCLKSDLYIGKVHYKTKIFQGLQEPIIDIETYNKTLSLFEARDFSKHNNKGNLYYLTGLIYCKHCGARFTSAVHTWKGKKYKYYICHSKRKSNLNMIKDKDCKNKTWHMEDLDQIIFDEISKLAMDTSHVHEIRFQKDDNLEKVEILKKELQKIDNQRNRLIDLYGLGTFTVDEIQAKIEPLNEKRKSISDEINTLESDKSLSEEDAIDYLSKWDDILHNGEFEQVRTLINALIEKIEIDDENVIIHWKFT